MINNIFNIGPVPDPKGVKPVADIPPKIAEASQSSETDAKKQNASDHASSKAPEKGPLPAYDLRLTVEKDNETGEVIYRAINRMTGEVVRQLPSKEVIEMKRNMKYQTGSIIKTDV